MAEVKKKTSKIWDMLVIFALIYLGSDLIFRYVWPSKPPVVPGQAAIEITMEHPSLTVGTNPAVVVHNNTATPLSLAARCPKPPVDLFHRTGASGTTLIAPVDSTHCESDAVTVPAHGKATLNLGPWKDSMLSERGDYAVKMKGASGATLQANFSVVEPGTFTKLFRTIITKPFLNFLILIASILPDHNLGIGIVLLTIMVKSLLFIPTQHALEGQKKMQLLQPKLEAVRKQYKDDPKRLNEETMKLWKENKVNPMQSCLPILIQFPVLIGLLYVVRDSSSLSMSHYLIYPIYQHITWDFNPHFLGLDLTKPNVWIFPPMLVIMQFIQMKLSFAIAKKKQKADAPKADAATDMQQKIMLYVLPLMIGYFAFKFPAAVSLYWGVSTLFAIGQQMIVNREHLKV